MKAMKRNDSIYFINAEDQKSPTYKVLFSGLTICVYEDDLKVKAGDFLERVLPNNSIERYEVVSTIFRLGGKVIKSHYEITLKDL